MVGLKGVVMTVSPDPSKLNNHHRDTLLKIFQHPTSHNIEWRDVASLLEVVGTIEEHSEGKFRVQLGTEVQFLDRPKHKDIDVQQVVDLRRMLTGAGYAPVVEELESRGVED
jgi:hypothetical protein